MTRLRRAEGVGVTRRVARALRTPNTSLGVVGCAVCQPTASVAEVGAVNIKWPTTIPQQLGSHSEAREAAMCERALMPRQTPTAASRDLQE